MSKSEPNKQIERAVARRLSRACDSLLATLVGCRPFAALGRINQRGFEAMTVLYKYRKYSARSLEVLIKKEIYFASPDQLNDPYDCRLNIIEAFSAAIEKARRDTNSALEAQLTRFTPLKDTYAKLQADIQGSGVFSLARSPKNVLMWSHYADDHRGFALGFGLSEKFRNSNQIIGAADAYYAKAKPFTKFIEGVCSYSQTVGMERLLDLNSRNRPTRERRVLGI